MWLPLLMILPWDWNVGVLVGQPGRTGCSLPCTPDLTPSHSLRILDPTQELLFPSVGSLCSASKLIQTSDP